MKQIKELAKKVKYEDGSFYWIKGASAGERVTKAKLYTWLEKLGIDEDDFEQAFADLEFWCKQNEKDKNEEYAPNEDIKSKLERLEVFKSFKLIQSRANDFPLLYENVNNTLRLVGHLGEVNGDLLLSHLEKYRSPISDVILEEFTEYVISKRNDNPSALQVFNYVLDKGRPFKDMVIHKIEKELHPVTVEGCEILSISKIPYVKKDVLKTDLNGKLREFLDNTTNHEHLCAIIWGILIGYRYPYLVYLKGFGGDGKSSFIKMLGSLLNDSIATFQESTQFSNRNMYNKAIINITENNNPYLLNRSVVKAITGGDFLNIEGKNKDGFNGQIMGIVMAASNIPLSLIGEDYESRRLRYFEVSKPQNSVLLGEEKYIQEISSTPNEFLNYCRQSFEKLDTGTGLLSDPPDLEQTLFRFQDGTISLKCKKFLEKFYKNTEFKEGLTLNRSEVLLKLEEEMTKDKFAKSNFDRYLLKFHNVTFEGDLYIGWGLKPKEKSNVIDHI